MAITERGILAGYDGSARSARALSWAAREAAARGESLAVCYAPPAGPASDAVGKVLAHRKGEQILAQGVRLAQGAGKGIKVEALLADGPAAAALCEHSGRADMVVVGSHGQGGGVPGTLLGSVSSQVAEYGEGRVVVNAGAGVRSASTHPARWWPAPTARSGRRPRSGSPSRRPRCGRPR